MNIFTECFRFNLKSSVPPANFATGVKIFLSTNTYYAAEFIGIAWNRIDVIVNDNIGTDPVLVGTKSKPLKDYGPATNSESDVIIIYNPEMFINTPALRAKHDDMEKFWLSIGWSCIAAALRKYVVENKGLIAPDNLIPAIALTNLKMPHIEKILGRMNEREQWPGHRTPEQIDIDIIASYVARKTAVDYGLGKAIELEDLVATIRETSGNNWRERLAS